MMTAPRSLRTAVALIVVAACSSGEPAADADPVTDAVEQAEPAGEVEPQNPSVRSGLAGTTWSLYGFAAADEIEPLPEGVDADLAFDEERISGTTGCNRYHGDYELEDGALTVGPVAATRMACPGPRMEVERRFLEALGGTLNIAIRKGQLWLSHEDETGLVFDPGAATD